MAAPLCKEKYNSKSVRTPGKFEFYRRKIKKWPKFKVPKAVILCYDSRIMEYVENNYKLEKHKAFAGDFWFIKNTGRRIAVFGNFGLGSAITGLRIEELIQFGIKKIISIGEAGGIGINVKIGDIVICNKALRDEAVSFHYLKPAKYVNASENILGNLYLYFKKKELQYFVGPTWTIDAIYRQTIAEIKKYKDEGVMTIDMEAATMFSIAKYRNIEAGAIFVISDVFKDFRWIPRFHKTSSELKKVFEIAKETLLNM